jgi:hypothetical protein
LTDPRSHKTGHPSTVSATTQRPLAPTSRINRGPLSRRPIGPIFARPWFDTAALWGLSRWAFPLSRALAAAAVAEGSTERFLAELPLARVPAGSASHLASALRHVEHLKRQHAAASARWDEAFFSPGAASPAKLVAIEAARRRTSHAYMMSGASFLRLRLRASWPPVRMAIPDRETVEARHGARLAHPKDAYRAPAQLPAVERSRSVSGPLGSEYWLRFASPYAPIGSLAWAHVYEPEGVVDPPSLVYVHGLGVEVESLDNVWDDIVVLADHGIRVVRLEAPWHNRRRRPGRFGGEPFLAEQPLAGLDHFAAIVPEIGIITDWCRRTSRGRVAIGGISLGALSTQLTASRSQDWPATLRADALYLATTSDDVGPLGFESSLARAVGLPDALAAAGWTKGALGRYAALTNPVDPPVMAPENIVMVLGTRDNLTPFAGGLALARRWGVPDSNLFLRDQGHFSVPVGMLTEPAPLRRLAEILSLPAP